VKELFEQEEPQRARTTRAELHRRIDGDYYGFRDEDDGILVKVEAEAEAAMRTEALSTWKEEAVDRRRDGEVDEALNAPADGHRFTAYVPLPDQKEIEAKVLQSKKMALLSKYVSEDLLREQQEVRELLNR
jgi:pre-mRNA-splicing factor ISY1